MNFMGRVLEFNKYFIIYYNNIQKHKFFLKKYKKCEMLGGYSCSTSYLNKLYRLGGVYKLD